MVPETQDWIASQRDAQAVLADRFAEEMFRDVASRWERNISVLWEALRVPKEIPREDLDLEAASDLLRSNLRHDALLALQGYTDWVASKLWRASAGNLGERAPLPRFDDGSADAVANRYSVDKDFVRGLVMWVARNQVKLPILGRVEGNAIRVDLESLTHWASHFQWTR